MPFGKREPAGYRGVERRRERRARVDFSAHIVLAAGQLVRCRVTDFSSAGARLAFSSSFLLPSEFELRGAGRDCHVRLVHRGMGYAGVQFV
jgi:hypothetical protein